jgi:hypothetical protein
VTGPFAGTTRRRAAAAAASALLALVLLDQPWSELPRRVETLRRFAPRELAVRRLGGSGAAFDRRYFVFLENARRRLPASARGVVLYGTPAADPYLFLAAYVFAPLPVHRAPEPPAEGWIAASYGGEAPPSTRVVAAWADGSLSEPIR